MAYRTRAKSKRPSRSYGARRSTARRTSRAPARRARRTGGGSARTIRIVIEQPSANSVQRPPIGMAPAAEPRKATF